MLSADERKILVELGVEKSEKVYKEAEAISKLGYWNLTGNRLYYSVFHMARTLLLDKGIEDHTHAGVIHLIGKNFISKGLLDKSYGRLFSRLFDLRQSGDYDDRFDATEEKVMPYFESTKAFINDMKSLLTFTIKISMIQVYSRHICRRVMLLMLFLLIPFAMFAQNLSPYDENRPVGWASVDSVCTGSGDANPIVVATWQQLNNQFRQYSVTPKTIYLKGEITVPRALIMRRMANVTIYGLPGSALVNDKYTIRNDSSGILYIDRCSNIILRNITFKGPGAFDRDANDNLTVSRTRHIWVDHCDFQDGQDGNFDCNKGSDYITVSWCRFRYLIAPWPKLPDDTIADHTDDHRFSNLWSSSDGDSIYDKGHLRTTFANCWWDEGCRTRMPFVRFGKIHILNCAYTSTVLSAVFNVRYLSNFYVENSAFISERSQSRTYSIASSALNTCNITFTGCEGHRDGQKRRGNEPYYIPDYAYNAYPAKYVYTVLSDTGTGAGATLDIEEGKPFTTAVAKVKAEDGGYESTHIYNVAGQRTDCLQRGMNIVYQQKTDGSRNVIKMMVR